MMMLSRVAAAVHLLKVGAEPIHKWRMAKGQCPLCGPKFFIAMGGSPILVRCISCRATVSTLSLIPVIQEHFGDALALKDAYELSSYGSVLGWLSQKAKTVTSSEYFPDHPFGSKVEGILNQDVQKLTFQDGSFDLVTSNHVFEHVYDDQAGFREISRVLRPGGAMIFSIPLYDEPETIRYASIENGEIKFVGEPEYHGSRLGGAKSAPVFWHHSQRDICDRIVSCGFKTAVIKKITLASCQQDPALVIYATK